MRWTLPAGVTHGELQRRLQPGAWQLLALVPALSYWDGWNLTPDARTCYRVRTYQPRSAWTEPVCLRAPRRAHE